MEASKEGNEVDKIPVGFTSIGSGAERDDERRLDTILECDHKEENANQITAAYSGPKYFSGSSNQSNDEKQCRSILKPGHPILHKSVSGQIPQQPLQNYLATYLQRRPSNSSRAKSATVPLNLLHNGPADLNSLLDQKVRAFEYRHHQNKREEQANLKGNRLKQSAHRSKQSNDEHVKNIVFKQSRKLFCIMDSDNDGLISPDQIELQDIDLPTLKLLSPILIELERTGAQWDLASFENRMMLLFKNLTPLDRLTVFYAANSKDKPRGLGCSVEKTVMKGDSQQQTKKHRSVHLPGSSELTMLNRSVDEYNKHQREVRCGYQAYLRRQSLARSEATRCREPREADREKLSFTFGKSLHDKASSREKGSLYKKLGF